MGLINNLKKVSGLFKNRVSSSTGALKRKTSSGSFLGGIAKTALSFTPLGRGLALGSAGLAVANKLTTKQRGSSSNIAQGGNSLSKKLRLGAKGILGLATVAGGAFGAKKLLGKFVSKKEANKAGGLAGALFGGVVDEVTGMPKKRRKRTTRRRAGRRTRRRAGRRTRRSSGRRVSFTTKDGRRVSFTTGRRTKTRRSRRGRVSKSERRILRRLTSEFRRD